MAPKMRVVRTMTADKEEWKCGGGGRGGGGGEVLGEAYLRQRTDEVVPSQ